MSDRKKKSEPLLLIDADILAWQAASSVEKVICFEGDSCFPVASLTDALASFDKRLEDIFEALESRRHLLCFSGSMETNFRRSINPLYKSNRQGKPKPVALQFLRDALCSRPLHTRFSRLEADDVMGILATAPQLAELAPIVVSLDKDMKTIPCRFYDIGKPEKGIQNITEAEADYWFMFQTLTGDSADGYPGCPGVGPVKARQILEEAMDKGPSLWECVRAAYIRQGLSEEEALLNARMARILRHEEYNRETGEVHLWTP